MPKRRISMRGMGADAFFNPPAEEKEEPVGQDDSRPEDQLADKTASLPTVLPASQQTSTPIDQHPSVPSSQDAIIPVNQGTSIPAPPQTDIPVTGLSHTQSEQLTSMPESQKTSEPTKQHASKPVGLIKATYYIHPDQDLKLERIRLARRMHGEKVDKSELIREAIDKLAE